MKSILKQYIYSPPHHQPATALHVRLCWLLTGGCVVCKSVARFGLVRSLHRYSVVWELTQCHIDILLQCYISLLHFTIMGLPFVVELSLSDDNAERNFYFSGIFILSFKLLMLGS